MAGQLHEVIAVEKSLREEAHQAIETAKALFTQGQSRLRGQTARYEPTNPDELTESSAVQVMETTVAQVLDNIAQVYGRYIDASLQKEQTNTLTEAYVIMDGEPITGPLAATALLNLEARLNELKKVYEAIPVNDVTRVWQYDEQRGSYMTEERRRIKMRKEIVFETMFDGNEKHPPQIDRQSKDNPVGYVYTRQESGCLTPADRRARLTYLGKLIRAVRQARERANRISVVDLALAGELFARINKGVV